MWLRRVLFRFLFCFVCFILIKEKKSTLPLLRCSTAYLYYDEEYLSSSCCLSSCHVSPADHCSSVGVRLEAGQDQNWRFRKKLLSFLWEPDVDQKGGLRCLSLKQRPNAGAEDFDVSSVLLLQHSECRFCLLPAQLQGEPCCASAVQGGTGSSRGWDWLLGPSSCSPVPGRGSREVPRPCCACTL